MGASENGAALICNWTRWRWEPIGAGWPLKSESYAPLADALRNASGVRAELREISTEQSHRSATLFEFERLHSLGRFPAAIALVGQLSDKDA